MVYDGIMTDGDVMDRGGGVAVWRQIAERLRTEIALQVWKTDEKLPSEAELAARFAVNRHTVRRALAALALEGVLRPDKGRGTFVAERPISYPISHRTRFSEIVSAQAREPGGRLISHGLEPADRFVAGKLGLAEGTEMVRVETARYADGVPISVGTNWYPAARVPGFVDAFQRTGSITRALAADGIADYTRRETTISADLAGPADAGILEVAVGDPLLVVDSVNDDAAGVPFNVARARFVAARVQLRVET